MSYIGNPIVSTDFPVDYFSGNNSTTAFTLSIAPASVNALDVQVGGVPQSPQTYTVSGTTLTFSTAPPTGSSNIIVRHKGVAGIPNVPSAGSVVSASFGTLATLPVSGGTLTLPSSTGTLLSTANPQSGGVIQVVNQVYSSNVSTTSSSQVDTGITASITPKFSTSKIIIFYYVNGITSVNSNASNTRMYLADGSNTNLIQIYDQWVSAGTSGPTACFSGEFSLLPATTSTVTYKVRYAATGSAGVQINSYWNGGGSTSSGIVLMEIAV